MANANKPTGLTPVSYLNGSDWDGRGNIYSILAADTNAFWVGDPVAPAATGGDVGGIPAVTVGTPGTGPWLGVVLAVGTVGALGGGPYIDPNNLTLTNRPAGAQAVNYYALVCDDPMVIFEAQENGAMTVSNIHNNVNLVAAAPATGVKVSGYQLNSASVAVTQSLDMRIMRLVKRADNAIGTNAKWHVMFNTHFYNVGNPAVLANIRIGV